MPRVRSEQIGCRNWFLKGYAKAFWKEIGVAICSVTEDGAVLQRCREVSQHIREEDGNAAVLKEVDNICASLDGETNDAHHNL